MFSYVDYLVFYFDDAFCEINRFFEQFCRYWRVEQRNVKINEFIVVFFWKAHTCNHTQSFRHISHVNHTELSKYLWTLKENGTGYHRKKSIKSYTSCDKCGTKGFDLCLIEKVITGLAELKVLLNKRTELISKCRHRNKFILNSVKKNSFDLRW